MSDNPDVISAIIETSSPPPGGGDQARGETSSRPQAAPSRGADGRFSAADQQDDDAAADQQDDDAAADQQDDDAAADQQDDDAAADQQDDDAAADQQDESAENAPENLDEYLVTITVDGKPAEVSLGELKRSYSGQQYVQQNIHQAVEYRKASAEAARQAHAVLQQQVDELTAIQEVWNKFSNPQVDIEHLRTTNPQQYAVKKLELIEAQEKAAKIRQEIEARQAQQAKILADAKAQRVQDETSELLRRLPALADPQTAPVVMGKIREVAQSYGVTDDELNSLDGHVPILILTELAWRREEMAAMDARLKRPTGNAPRPKTLIRPGTAKPAQSSTKKLEAQLLNRARQSGKPDDVAATLLVSRKK